jgi:hypothetical protein
MKYKDIEMWVITIALAATFTFLMAWLIGHSIIHVMTTPIQ